MLNIILQHETEPTIRHQGKESDKKKKIMEQFEGRIEKNGDTV